jgi:hypothetical protein
MDILFVRISFLAGGTKMGSPLPYHDPLNRSAADRTRLPFSAVDTEVILKISSTIHPVDTRTITPDSLLQGFPYRMQQTLGLIAAEFARNAERMQFRFE